MKPINEMSMVFRSRSVNERFSRMAVACFAAQLDPTLDELNDIKTAVSEAVTNCIVHAYPNTIGKIALKGRIFSNGKLELTITDSGVGISDIEKAREPLFTTGGSDRSGMGFTIMESFMDRLSVKSRAGGGTIIKMIKSVSPRVSGK